MPYGEPDPEDPLALTGVMLPAPDEQSLQEMAECFIEEFLRDGWTPAQLKEMFRNPFYRGPYLVWRAKGDAYVEGLLQEMLQRRRIKAR